MFLQARAGITEIHFLPFNPTDKRTALTYIDSNGKWFRASKGAPEQAKFGQLLHFHSILLSLNRFEHILFTCLSTESLIIETRDAITVH